MRRCVIWPGRRTWAAGLGAAALALAGAAQAAGGIPGWLAAHEGTGPGQIAPVVLERARAFYLQKRAAGAVENPCYLAMDATRPNADAAGPLPRFYVICEATRRFTAVPAGHGGGRRLEGVADFGNDRICAKNFGTAEGSLLTAGGRYLTAEARSGFQGYARGPGGQLLPFSRTFVQFDGEGETANARARAIGGHAAELVRAACRMKAPGDPHADADGFVPVGTRVVYAAGRSNGCTSWAPQDAAMIEALIRDRPTTLYIYPEADDIAAVAAGRAGAYWNAGCLKAIGAPAFWPQATLGPVIARWDAAHPPVPRGPLPICRG